MEDNTPDSGNGEFRRLERVCARHRVSLFFAGVLDATPSDGGDVGWSSRVNALERALECPRCRALNDLDAPTPAGPVVNPTTATIMSGNTPSSAPRAATDHREFGMIPPAGYEFGAARGRVLPKIDIGWVILVVAVFAILAAIAVEGMNDDRSAEAGVSEGSGNSVEYADLKVGDCVQDMVSEDNYDLIVVDCTKPHTDEVYATFTLPQEDWPGTREVDDLGWQGCDPRYEEYVGKAPDDSDLDQYIHPPVKAGWDEDRVVVCTVADGEEPTTGTLRNADR